MSTAQMPPHKIWLDFGQWIADKRIALRVKQKILASRLQISPTQMSRIERGVSGTTATIVDQLIQELRLNPIEAKNRAHLLGGFSPPMLSIIQEIMDLPEDVQMELRTHIQLALRMIDERQKNRIKIVDPPDPISIDIYSKRKNIS